MFTLDNVIFAWKIFVIALAFGHCIYASVIIYKIASQDVWIPNKIFGRYTQCFFKYMFIILVYMEMIAVNSSLWYFGEKFIIWLFS